MKEKKELVSIIVPLFNHLEDLTIPFIERVINTTGNWELILVDNGSSDNTWEYIQKRARMDKRIRVFHNSRNKGFSGGNNTGYRQAVGGQICFISNDVIIHDYNWLDIFVEAWEKEPKCLFGQKLVTGNMLTVFKNRPTPYLTGHVIFGEKKLFEMVSPKGEVWNEDFDPAYFEDVWLSVTAEDLGYKLKELTLPLEHLISKSSDKMDINQQAKRSQIVFHNKMMKRMLKRENRKRVVFFVPSVPYPFYDGDFEGKGVGGAEASLILLARELANKGYLVEVYNRAEVTGTFRGVEYHHVNEFTYTDYCDLFVLFRSYSPVLDVVNAQRKVFWSCDQYTDLPSVWEHCVFPQVNMVVAISEYHKKFIKEHYELSNYIKVIDLGINYDDYLDIKESEKVANRIIFCSVPNRGLDNLYRMAPRIREKVEDLEIIITSDYRLWGLDQPDNYVYRTLFDNYDYVRFVGKVPRQELVEYQRSSKVMAYPTNYNECFCISAMECMAAGAVPVTFDLGALPDTVGEGGVVLSNTGGDDDYVNSIIRLLKNEITARTYRKKGYQIAKEHDWRVIANEWVKLIEEEIMPTTVKMLADQLKVTTWSVKKSLNMTKFSRLDTPLSEMQVNKVMADVKNNKAFIRKLTPQEIKDLEGNKQKTTVSELKIPSIGMPSQTVITTKKPVEITINGNMFTSAQAEGTRLYQLKVPYEFLPSAVQIISDAYGPDIIV